MFAPAPAPALAEASAMGKSFVRDPKSGRLLEKKEAWPEPPDEHEKEMLRGAAAMRAASRQRACYLQRACRRSLRGREQRIRIESSPSCQMKLTSCGKVMIIIDAFNVGVWNQVPKNLIRL